MQRLKVVRTSEIRKKKMEYLRFTRAYEATEVFYYVNGIKLDPLYLPNIVDKIYKRRALRKKYGKSTQIDEIVIFTYLGDTMIDVEFPTEINPEILDYGKPKFILLENVKIFPMRRHAKRRIIR